MVASQRCCECAPALYVDHDPCLLRQGQYLWPTLLGKRGSSQPTLEVVSLLILSS